MQASNYRLQLTFRLKQEGCQDGNRTSLCINGHRCVRGKLCGDGGSIPIRLDLQRATQFPGAFPHAAKSHAVTFVGRPEQPGSGRHSFSLIADLNDKRLLVRKRYFNARRLAARVAVDVGEAFLNDPKN